MIDSTKQAPKSPDATTASLGATPGPKTANSNKRPANVVPNERKPIEAILHECRRTFYVAIALTVVIDILGIVPMLFMWNVMDLALPSRSMVTMVSLLTIVIGAYVFWSSLEWIRQRLMTRLSLRIDWDLSADIFDASFRRHVMRKNVDVQQQLKDLATLRQFLTGSGAITLIDAPFAIFYLALAWIFSPWIAVFVLGSMVLMSSITYFASKATTPILQVASDANSESARVAHNSLRHAESSLALGMMPAVRQKWYGHHHRYLENQVNASEASGVAQSLSEFFSKSMASLQMGVSTMLAIEGLITGGMVMAANLLIQKAVTPINSLTAGWSGFVETRLAYERLNALLESDAKRGTQMELPAVIGSLAVAKASSVPPGGNKAVLFDIDFQMKPGQVVAVVGPSAAGKTCLARMLIGVWKPARGSVRLDGVEVSDWDHDEFGPQIGYVPQEIEFFEGTVAENIARLGEIVPEKVVQAAKLIGMHETILAFPKGYDTEIGETGFALSGGQRQRLAICRALYGIPKYIVMDEPNANLDEIGESALVNAIAYLKTQGCTVIITTHRPRLVSVADNLLVLRNGTQVGFGPAEEMINAVRNLQLVAQNADGKSSGSDSQDSAVRDGTTNQPVSGSVGSGPLGSGSSGSSGPSGPSGS